MTDSLRAGSSWQALTGSSWQPLTGGQDLPVTGRRVPAAAGGG
ncbi:MAG TPA: hypothetical protein VMV92_07265 [Streptosporangiaceae bacterium]|nr:hypothetical protein [Streptosporangiaceae bacterium]